MVWDQEANMCLHGVQNYSVGSIAELVGVGFKTELLDELKPLFRII